jgi:uncharacterized protein YcbK (DUF882 family)
MRRALVFSAAILACAHAYGDAPKKAATGNKPQTKPGTIARVAKPAAATPPKYAQYVKSWHTPTPNKAPPVDASGRPMLALFALNTGDRIELPALSERGGFAASLLDRAAFVMRESYSGNEHPIEPRLLDVVYALQTHFNAHEVRMVSGYRTPHHGASNHGRGRAMDLVIPGASDEDVAKFAREMGFVGVGVYPTSGFVHVDVRDRSYFWVDASGPGRRNRERGILGDLAKKSDQRAASRGDKPTPPFFVASDVDAALGSRNGTTAPPLDDDDDDTD